MFTGLAHTWVHMGAPQGASGLLQVPRESSCHALGLIRTYCLFSFGDRAGPAVARRAFLLCCDARISLLVLSPFGGPVRTLLMGTRYQHKAATRWYWQGNMDPVGWPGSTWGKTGARAGQMAMGHSAKVTQTDVHVGQG